MHRRIVGSIIAILMSLALPAEASDLPVGANWFLFKMKAGPAGAVHIRTTVTANASRTDGMGVLGFGVGNSFDGGYGFDFTSIGGGNYEISTTRSLGSVSADTTIESTSPASISDTSGIVLASAEPDETIAFAFLVTGYQLTSVNVTPPTVDSGSIVETTTSSGSGATVLVSAPPTSEGTALVVGPVVVGDFTETRNLAVPIVGGFTDFCNPRCTYNWKASDGTLGSGDVLNTPFGGSQGCVNGCSFAGPKGTWEWSWSGTELHVIERSEVPRIASPTAYAAFFPAGDDWTLFRSRDPYPGP